jgi:hypothetical protein
MLGAKAALLSLLALLGLLFVGVWYQSERRASKRAADSETSAWWALVSIGALTDFLDTLGVGSFATTTSLYRLSRRVRDEHIPGTLNTGHTLPTLAQAFIYIAIVRVDMLTLALMVGAATAGAFIGAGIVAHWSRRKIQLGMGVLLIAAALVIVVRQLHVVPNQGLSLGLSGAGLLAGVTVNFVLGALMTLGIGLYAPCMILVSLLGMNPQAAFPIMMGSCAFLMPVASVRFVRARRYDLPA